MLCTWRAGNMMVRSTEVLLELKSGMKSQLSNKIWPWLMVAPLLPSEQLFDIGFWDAIFSGPSLPNSNYALMAFCWPALPLLSREYRGSFPSGSFPSSESISLGFPHDLIQVPGSIFVLQAVTTKPISSVQSFLLSSRHSAEQLHVDVHKWSK